MKFGMFRGDHRSRNGHKGGCHSGHGHEEAMFAGRFGRGFGGGRPGGRGWGGFGDGGDFPGGRKLSSDDLQLVLESLLMQAPAHGYDLIRQIETLSGGFYKPSPGMVYPALTYLEDAGLAEVQPAGARKLYALTEEGKTHYRSQAERAEAIIAALTRIGSRMGEVRDAFAGVNDMDPAAGDALHAARHGLKRALMRRRGCDAREAMRIAEILNRATREIESDGTAGRAGGDAPAAPSGRTDA
ncbi:PadR family transcriptional regulator [Tanticharoenia sakaeratensis]|nr:PadR family transcriptional regulator [Tanticharoenia sakaeratensis]